MDSTHSDGEELGHIVPLKILFGVFGALLVLTVVTVAVSYIDLGDLNLVVAMAIATLKATLVALFFMHLWWDRGFNRIALFVGMVFFLLFVAITVMDTGAYRDVMIWQ